MQSILQIRRSMLRCDIDNALELADLFDAQAITEELFGDDAGRRFFEASALACRSAAAENEADLKSLV
jgi:hypothetical protein